MHPLGGDLDQDEVRRVDPLLEIVVHLPGPMPSEAALVADQLGKALHGDEEGLVVQQAGFRLVAEPDLGIMVDIGDDPAVLQREEIAVALEIDLTIVAHGPACDRAIDGAGGKDGEIDIAHYLRNFLEGLAGHGILPLGGVWRGTRQRQRRSIGAMTQTAEGL